MPKLLLIGIYLASACLSSPRLFAQTDSNSLESIFAKLAEKRKDPQAYTIKLTGTKTSHIREGPNKGETLVTKTEKKATFDWARGRYRIETKTVSPSGIETVLKIYDGKELKGHAQHFLPDGTVKPGSKNVIGIGSGNLKPSIFGCEDWPIFFAKGVICPGDNYYPGHLVFDPDVSLCHLDRTETTDGRQVSVIRTTPIGQGNTLWFSRFTMDARGDAFITRYEGINRINGQDYPKITLDCAAPSATSKPLPASWKFVWYNSLDVSFTDEISVKDVSLVGRAADREFDIPIPEGQVVERITHHEPVNGKQLRADIETCVMMEGKLVLVSGKK